MERIDDLKSALTRVYDAMAAADVETLDELMSPRAGFLVVGTDPGEWWDDRARFLEVQRAQLTEMGGLRFEPGEIQADVEGDVGWLANRVTAVLGDGARIPARITAVCVREAEGWRFVQWHASVGAANQEVLGRELTV